MTEVCKVSKIKNSTPYIKLVMADKCGGCKACAFGKNKELEIPAICELNVKIGDDVLVEMPKKQVPAASIYMYLIPIVFMVVGFFLGALLKSEIFQLLFALLFAVLSFVVLYFIDKKVRKNKTYMPVITKIITCQNFDKN